MLGHQRASPARPHGALLPGPLLLLSPLSDFALDAWARGDRRPWAALRGWGGPRGRPGRPSCCRVVLPARLAHARGGGAPPSLASLLLPHWGAGGAVLPPSGPSSSRCRSYGLGGRGVGRGGAPCRCLSPPPPLAPRELGRPRLWSRARRRPKLPSPPSTSSPSWCSSYGPGDHVGGRGCDSCCRSAAPPPCPSARAGRAVAPPSGGGPEWPGACPARIASPPPACGPLPPAGALSGPSPPSPPRGTAAAAGRGSGAPAEPSPPAPTRRTTAAATAAAAAAGGGTGAGPTAAAGTLGSDAAAVSAAAAATPPGGSAMCPGALSRSGCRFGGRAGGCPMGVHRWGWRVGRPAGGARLPFHPLPPPSARTR